MTPSHPLPFHNLLLGTDLVFVPRLGKSHQRYGDVFFEKLLTPQEWVACNRGENPKPLHVLRRAAGKIAIKEAVSKALGTGLNGLGWGQGVGWLEIETIAQNQSPPGLQLSGRAFEVATRLGVRDWRVSLSHEGDYAISTVIGLV